jgi:hypothetical protein
MLLHKSGQFIADTALLHLVKDDPQAHGSAMTYLRRYSYMAILGLVADEDDDGNAASQPKPPSRTRSAGKGNTRTPAPEPPSGADNAPQGASDGDDSGAITTETLEALRAAYKSAKVTPAQLKAILKEVGAEGRKTDELTEDQGTWTVLKLQAMAKGDG